MKVEGYVFSVFTSFLSVTAVVYWFTSKDPTGTAALSIAAGLGVLVGGYLLVTAKRMGPRPSDLPDAEVGEQLDEGGHRQDHRHHPEVLRLQEPREHEQLQRLQQHPSRGDEGRPADGGDGAHLDGHWIDSGMP